LQPSNHSYIDGGQTVQWKDRAVNEMKLAVVFLVLTCVVNWLVVTSVQTVARHFVRLQVNEKEVLTYFLYMCKNSSKSGRLDTSGTTSGGGGAESSN